MLGFAALGELALGQIPVFGKIVQSDVANLAITGQDANIYCTRLITADAAALTLTFGSIELVKAKQGLHVLPGGGARGITSRTGGGAKGLRIRA